MNFNRDAVASSPALCCPGCGCEQETRFTLAIHKQSCALLRQRVIEEIKRLAGELGRAPSTSDWILLASKQLPTVTWLSANLGWSQLLAESGYTPLKGPKEDPAWMSGPAPRYYWQDEEEALREYGYNV